MTAGKRTLLKTLISSYVYLTRQLGVSLAPHSRRSPHGPPFQTPTWAAPQKADDEEGSCPRRRRAVVCSVEGGLLRSPSTFPYFMVVALEMGSLGRALLLLLLYPLLVCCASEEARLRAMAMVCFRGVKVEGFRVGRAVLPKHLLEDVGLEGFRLLTAAAAAGGKKVCVTRMPRVMVEAALKEYLGVEVVVGRELKVSADGRCYTGFMEKGRDLEEVLQQLFGDQGEGNGDGEGVLWVGSRRRESRHHHPFFSKCNEVVMVSEAEKRRWRPLPGDKYPKPLVFHDGRIAFRPTPAATLAMFLWLPVGFFLTVLRAVALFSAPYKLSIPIVACTGMTNRLIRSPAGAGAGAGRRSPEPRAGRLYACNHRTLFDPIYISGSLGKPVTAVTYSLSRMSEVLAPIRTVRLTREREEDRRRMEAELRRGDLVVCPEGTTCREPYLLRFSPLFVEVAEEAVIPVALQARAAMFYGTTAGGRKWMDPLLFAMDPFPSYYVEFLPEVPVVRPDGMRRSSREVANQVQADLAQALGFQRTTLTRKDKYLMLADNEGFVEKSTAAVK